MFNGLILLLFLRFDLTKMNLQFTDKIQSVKKNKIKCPPDKLSRVLYLEDKYGRF